MDDDDVSLLSARQRARPGSSVIAFERRDISARLLRFEPHRRTAHLEHCSSAAILRAFKLTAALKSWLRGAHGALPASPRVA